MDKFEKAAMKALVGMQHDSEAMQKLSQNERDSLFFSVTAMLKEMVFKECLDLTDQVKQLTTERDEARTIVNAINESHPIVVNLTLTRMGIANPNWSDARDFISVFDERDRLFEQVKYLTQQTEYLTDQLRMKEQLLHIATWGQNQTIDITKQVNLLAKERDLLAERVKKLKDTFEFIPMIVETLEKDPDISDITQYTNDFYDGKRVLIEDNELAKLSEEGKEK